MFCFSLSFVYIKNITHCLKCKKGNPYGKRYLRNTECPAGYRLKDFHSKTKILKYKQKSQICEDIQHQKCFCTIFSLKKTLEKTMENLYPRQTGNIVNRIKSISQYTINPISITVAAFNGFCFIFNACVRLSHPLTI